MFSPRIFRLNSPPIMAASQSTIKALNSEAFHKEFTSIFCTMLLNYSRFPMVRYGKRYGSVVQQDD
ncbi:hypothetical protein BN1007_150178 [Klebsiella variicola]|nr:hypothetical protein BN1007_150178 [Klebsiella variicola]